MAENYEVEQGDCVSSVAFEYGLPWETLWNHSDNAHLKQARKNPNMLKCGDTLHVPDLTTKEYERPTEQRHQFKLKGEPVRLRLRIMEAPPPKATNRATVQEGSQNGDGKSRSEAQATKNSQKEEPRSDLPFILAIDGKLSQGRTTSDGLIECAIPPNAQMGQLILEPGTPAEFIVLLKLGCLEPIEEVAGAQARLNNLGFKCGVVDGIIGPRTKTALRRFQESNGLKTSGELDEPTRSKLREAHDSK